MGERNEKREIEIFKSFVAICELPLRLDSIIKKYPPNPDIQCRMMGAGLLAFELVEIIDKGYANRKKKNENTINQLKEYHVNLPNKEKALFDQLYSHAYINIDFHNDCTLRQRKILFPKIFKILLAQSGHFENNNADDIFFDNQGKLISIEITKIKEVQCPYFDVPSGGFFLDCAVSAINSKCKKKYKSENPMHLLAYYNDTPRIPENRWLSKIEDFFKKHGRKCQFEKVWIFDFAKKIIKFEYSQSISP